jgi:hypothetical protein
MDRKRHIWALISACAALCVGAAALISASPASAVGTDCNAVHTESRLPQNPVLYAKRGQYWYARTSPTSGSADICFIFGNADDIGVMGDWNGDGMRTPGVFRPSNGTWYVSDDIYAAQVSGVFPFGSPGDIPIAADWNHDGVETLGVFRPNEGTWYITDHDRSMTAERSYRFASPGDVPLPLSGGTGSTVDLWAYRPSTATWWHAAISGSSAPQVTNFIYGNPGDQAVGSSIMRPGCATTPIVFRPATATWFSQQNEPWQFGSAGDQMLLSPAIPPEACAHL